MVQIVEANIFTTKCEIIAHQVNCQGVMGAGVAKQIRDKYPEANAKYEEFCESCINHPKFMLGKTQFVKATNEKTSESKIIANMFAQLNYGSQCKLYTDYDALRKCLTKLKEFGPDMSIAIPYGVGCGLGGGDWNGVVFPMINEIFEDYAGTVILYRK